MHQLTRSTSIEVKKNGTLKWLEKLPRDEKNRITVMAMKRRGEVMKQYVEQEEATETGYNDEKREALRVKAKREKEILSRQPLVTSSVQLREALKEIESGEGSNSKKKKRKARSITYTNKN